MPNACMTVAPPQPRFALAAGLLLLLAACAAPQKAPPAPAKPAAPPAVEAPSLGGRMTADAQEYPWSALGRINLAGQGFCTGVLIGPRQVLTQARCLYDARDGRWFRPQELHFIAAYQRDVYLAHSPVADFSVAPGFNPQGGTSLANITNNWAVVQLAEPNGNAMGWLGLVWDSEDLQGAARRGEAAYLRAGYRADLPHAVSLHFGCREEANGLVKLCAATPSELSLPAFVLTAGELRVLGDFYLQSPYQADAFTAATQVALDGNRMGRAQPPTTGGQVGRQPTATAAQLLASLGYDVSGGRIDAAAAAFRRDNGLPPGGVDLGLLAALVSAAQRSGS